MGVAVVKKALLALAVGAAVVSSAPALAADIAMPVKAAPAYAPVFNWTGFYVGGFIGGAFADRNATSSEPCTVIGCVSLFTQGGVVVPNSTSLDSSFTAGATIGYNWQAPGSAWVFGLEGEVGWMRVDGSVRDVNAPPPALSPGGFDSTEMGDFYAIIAGRLGYSFGTVLLYAKGGIAFVDKNYSYTSNIGISSVTLTHDETQVTWALGAGLEWAFAPKWSLKGEYLYIDTRETYTARGTIVGGAFNGAAVVNTHSDPGLHTLKLGVNYRF